MEPISRVDQVLILLRQQLAGRATTRPNGGSPAPTGQAQRSGGALPLQDLVARRLTELRAAGLKNRDSLVRLLLEEMLTAQFGSQLVNDAAFQQVISEVQAALEGDDELRLMMEQLLDE